MRNQPRRTAQTPASLLHPISSRFIWRFRIESLIKIDPENARQQRDRWRQWQEKNHGPDRGFCDPPSRNSPQQRRNQGNDHERQAEADVHGAQEVPFFALKLEIADGAALVHPWQTAKNGIPKNASLTAARATLSKNRRQGCGLCCGFHLRLRSVVKR